jgi:hypothetical protein
MRALAPLRASEETRLATGRKPAIEDKHRHDRVHGEANATERPRQRCDPEHCSTHDQPQQGADQSTG